MSRSVDPLVMGRVIGDVIDMFVPSVDMAVVYTSRQVKNGCQMKPSAASDAPGIRVTDKNGTANTFFTLIMTDPDAPSPSEPTLREWVHWIVTDIPAQSSNTSPVVIKRPMAGQGSSKRAREPGSISKQPNLERQKKGPAAASSTTGSSTTDKDKKTITEGASKAEQQQQQDAKSATSGKEVVPYVGPTPPIGIHRYIFVLYRQPSEQPLSVTPPPMRHNFNTRRFAVEHGLGLPVAATYFNAAKEPGTRRR